MSSVNQSDLQCPRCAGQCAYSPEHGGLLCQSCGEHQPIAIDPNSNPAKEFQYHPDLPHTEQTEITGDETHQCQTCGGTVVFTGPALSELCVYCNGPMVLGHQDASYETLGMIPFALNQEAAQKRAIDWIRRRRAAPNDLESIISQGRVAGIYVPFWTFDSAEAIDYVVRYRVKRGKNWVSRTLRSAMRTAFDDLLVPASPHVTPLIRDGILHDFDPDELRPYTPAYLAGFAAERHHTSVTQGLRDNTSDKDILIRNRIKRHSGKARITSISYKTHTTGIKYRRILLPVWILHYRYNDKPMKVVTCGLHGRTFGERPFSNVKLFGYSATFAFAALVIGFVWGASGML